MAYQNTSLTIVSSTVYSGTGERKQSSVSLAFVREIHRWLVNSLHKGQVTRKMFPFDNVIVHCSCGGLSIAIIVFNHSWWRHQVETFSALLVLCAGNSPPPGEFPAQRPVTRNFDVSLICARINDWVNNGVAGDLRRHRAHYDVIVIVAYHDVMTWKHFLNNRA